MTKTLPLLSCLVNLVILACVIRLDHVTAGPISLAGPCPKGCQCQGLAIDCRSRLLRQVPSGLPLNVEKLNLIGNKITIIRSTDFKGLKHLQTLQISNNLVATIERGSFDDLTDLRRLRLNRNRLQNIPGHLFLKTSNLQRLDLRDNEIRCISDKSFLKLRVLKELHLERNALTSFQSKSLAELKTLTVLRLDNNPIQCTCRLNWLHQRLTTSPKLDHVVVCVGPSKLAGRPLGQLSETDLQCPEGSSNDGGDDPSSGELQDACANLSQCSVRCTCTEDGMAQCARRGLTEVPADLPEEIQDLDLQHNALTTLPTGAFSKYKNLRKLLLNGNKITTIAEYAFRGLTRLSALYLNFNKLKTIPPNAFTGLENLLFLYLHGNEISCVPVNSFAGLSRLYLLHLSENRIQTLTNGTFNDLQRLRYLYLLRNPLVCDCRLAWLPPYLSYREGGGSHFATCARPEHLAQQLVRAALATSFHCPPGVEVAWTGNNRSVPDRPCDPEHACPDRCRCSEGGATVDCSRLNLTVIPGQLSVYTEELIMKENRIEVIEKSPALTRLPYLRILDLSNNRINRIEAGAFASNIELRKLILSNNSITHLDDRIFKGLKKLEILLIHKNKIKCINNDTFVDTPGLKVLMMNDNDLKCIMQGSFDSLKQFETLSLHHNPLDCNCHISWLPAWLRANVARTVAGLGLPPQCSAPNLLAGTPVTSLTKQYFKCQGNTVGPERLGCQNRIAPCCSKDAISCDPQAYCPPKCKCEGTRVECNEQHLDSIPDDIPVDTTELYLEHNSIKKINISTLSRLIKLQTLVLSYNAITELNAGTFARLNNLRTLIVSYNKLQCIDAEAFAGLRELRVLILQSNDISIIPFGAFKDLINLNNIALGQNPFYCDCNAKWLNNFFRARFLDNGIAVCTGPPSMKLKSIYHSKASDFVCPVSSPALDPYVAAKCNACLAEPCKHGGTCDLVTHLEYTCQCQHPYHGPNCEKQINACFGQPCQNGGTCKFIDNYGNYECVCAAGFRGLKCTENINDCIGHQCRNGGVCVDLIGDYKCRCQPGFQGRYCESSFRYCSDVNPCKNNAQCMPVQNGYRCICREGWTGKDCEVDVDDCKYNACQNQATCMDEVNTYTCKCRPGYTGKFCQNLAWEPSEPAAAIRSDSPCSYDQCQNGGQCLTLQGGLFVCRCQEGFGGRLCEQLLSVSFTTEHAYARVDPPSRGFLIPRGNVTLELATRQSEGVILYYADGNQFLAVDLFQGHIRISFSLGQLPGSEGYSVIQVNDNQPRSLELDIRGENVSLYIDRQYHSALRAAYQQVPGGRYLALTTPIYVGGAPAEVLQAARQAWRITSARSFSGCLGGAYINGEPVDFARFRDKSSGLTPGCPTNVHPTYTTGNPCKTANESSVCLHEGQCIGKPSLTVPGLPYTCLCQAGFAGSRCEVIVRNTGALSPSGSNTNPSTCHRDTRKAFLRDPETNCTSRRKVKLRSCSGRCSAAEAGVGPESKPKQGGECCRPQGHKKRRIRFTCSDGRVYDKQVKLIRKCACGSC